MFHSTENIYADCDCRDDRFTVTAEFPMEGYLGYQADLSKLFEVNITQCCDKYSMAAVTVYEYFVSSAINVSYRCTFFSH